MTLFTILGIIVLACLITTVLIALYRKKIKTNWFTIHRMFAWITLILGLIHGGYFIFNTLSFDITVQHPFDDTMNVNAESSEFNPNDMFLVIQNKCASCHHWANNYLEVSKFMTQASPEENILYQVIRDNKMPPPGYPGFTEKEKNQLYTIIKKWGNPRSPDSKNSNLEK